MLRHLHSLITPSRRMVRVLLSVAAVSVSVFPLTSAMNQPATPEQELTGLDPKAMLEFARLGSGFIVWERHLDDSWQIWSKQLDGSAEERLVPAEPRHHHFCPKISPDGGLLAYMSYRLGTNPYPKYAGHTGTLWLMNLRKGTREVLVEEARSYGQDRAVVWRDNKRLFYINEFGETRELDIRTKTSTKALNYRDPSFGYLPSPDLSYAIPGDPEFAPVKDGTIMHQRMENGCQPYFTSDSRWGFWTAGSGGPLQAMFLGTRVIHTLIESEDTRLPKDRNYVYFPMISPCMTTLAFSASQHQHSHIDGNYNLYLATINPHNLQVVNNPIRYTKLDGCDRFPDVYRRLPDLGVHFVEGRTPVKLSLPQGRRGSYLFDFGDNSSSKGSTASHAYGKPGDYRVTATSEGGHVVLRGFVHVDVASPPKLVRVTEEDGQLLLVFDKAVNIDTAKISVNNTSSLPLEPMAENHTVRVKLPRDLPAERRLTVEGVTSTTPEALPMPRSVMPVASSTWPLTTHDLAFAWRDATASGSQPGTAGRVTRSGLAFADENGAMKLQGGTIEFPDDGARIARRIGASEEFSIEAVITSNPPNEEPAHSTILSLTDASGNNDFSIAQVKDRIILNLRSKDSAQPLAVNFRYIIDRRVPQHILMRRDENSVSLFIKGVRVADIPVDRASLGEWSGSVLRAGSAGWRGNIERIAVYDRAFSEDECKAAARLCDNMVNTRKILPQWRAMATLIESTPAPTLEEIQPYRDALVRNLYEVSENLEGLLPKRIVVTQWAWLGGKKMPVQSFKLGDKVQLVLHEAALHPEVKPLVTKDALSSGFDLPTFQDVSDWDVPPVNPR